MIIIKMIAAYISGLNALIHTQLIICLFPIYVYEERDGKKTAFLL
jgi:hypothetical protein